MNSLDTRTVHVYNSTSFSPDCCLKRFEMLPDTILDFAIDWSAFLADDTTPDIIATSNWTVTLRNAVGTASLIATNDFVSGNSDKPIVFLDATGAEDTQIYTVRNDIATAAGRVIYACFEIQITSCDC